MFEEIKVEENLEELVKVVFNTDLKLDGAWGYSKALATVIKEGNDTPTLQIEFTLATMRAYLEMNMTLEENVRYSAINLQELSREKVDSVYDKVKYEISAIKETEYKAFIKEYKENSDKSDFDMTAHFMRRSDATLKREVIHWFKV
ncbi:MAG: Unknown protein [uncultured Sulfurovum sp.]|uniref:Uncharacterized protein n=1 Tax=uncultured Sulfurovum sp. TaxID=269237 RepID=A0A6S6TJ15_9BACT|nr:MAG: Unknown protein [uncultured Sulfurovum sp.]